MTALFGVAIEFVLLVRSNRRIRSFLRAHDKIETRDDLVRFADLAAWSMGATLWVIGAHATVALVGLSFLAAGDMETSGTMLTIWVVPNLLLFPYVLACLANERRSRSLPARESLREDYRSVGTIWVSRPFPASLDRLRQLRDRGGLSLGEPEGGDLSLSREEGGLRRPSLPATTTGKDPGQPAP